MASTSSPLSTELRLLRLERRVDQIERTIGLCVPRESAPLSATVDAVSAAPAPVPAPAPTAPVVPPPLPTPEPIGESRQPIARIPSSIASELSEETFPRRAGFSLHAKNIDASTSPPARPLPYAAPRKPSVTERESRSPRELEQTIGLQWAGWIGAMVLVIGAALGVKYAYDHHWFGHLPASAKLALIVAAGFGLIGAGEIVFRRIHKVPAASLFGAGVATLFIAAYAGHQFELYTATSAQMAMTLATLIGAAVAMRGNLVSIAVLALIGGNVAPLIVGDPNTQLLPLIGYLLMLQIVALALAAWGNAGKWWTLRGLSLATTSLWMAAKLATPSSARDAALLGAMITFGALYHFELIATAWRRSLRHPAAEAASPITFGFFVTAALTLGGLWYFQDASRAMRGEWVIDIAVAIGLIGFALPRFKTSLAPLGVAYRIAAAALIVLAVSVGFGGESILIGWMILSLAFALTGALTGSRVAPYASIITWLLTLARLCSIVGTTWFGDTRAIETIWLTVLNTPIAAHAILGWLLAVIGHAIVRLVHKSDKRRGSITLISAIASAIWVGTSIVHLPAVGASAMIICGAWLLLTIGHCFDRTRTNIIQAASMLVIATVKWALIDALAARLSPNWSANQYMPIFNPLMLTGCAIAASLAGIYFLRGQALRREIDGSSEHARSPATVFSLISLMIAVITVAFSFEIDRTIERAALVHALHSSLWQLKHLSWTMLWCAAWCSVAFAAVKILREGNRRRSWESLLWIVPTLLIAKYIVIDTILVRGRAGGSIAPVLNLQTAAGVVVIATIAVTRALMARGVTRHDRMRGQLSLMGVLVIGWMGTLEIARAVDWYGFIASFHVKNLCWTAWWMTCTIGSFTIGRRVDPDAPANEAWHVVLPRFAWLIALKYLIVDTVIWRAMHAPMPWPLVVNLDAMTAAVVVAGLAALRTLGLPASARTRDVSMRARAAMFAVLVLLWAGTIEIDRAFALPAIRAGVLNPWLAEQVALSIYWSLFGVATVVFGFVLRTARLRYFGLSLLALTLAKVLLIDTRGVDSFYRIVSFLGLGALLLGVSVVYGKVSPKLLAEPNVLST